MAVIHPPITGDAEQDSWTYQVTKLLNSGDLGTGSGTSTIGSGEGEQGSPGTDGFNTATLYLFTRTETDVTPATIDEALIYTYSLATIETTGGDASPFEDTEGNDTWYHVLPTVDQIAGEYIWATVVHVADQENTEAIAPSSWSSVAKLAEGGQDGLIVTVSTHLVPSTAAVDFGALTYASKDFRNDSTETKLLVAKVFAGNTEWTTAEYNAASYKWIRGGADNVDGNTFVVTATQKTNTGATSRAMIIDNTNVDNQGEDVFVCEITF